MANKLLAEAISALNLVDIYLYSSSVERFEEIESNFFPEKMQQESKLSITAEFLEPKNSKNEERFIHAKVEFGYRYVVNDDNDKLKALSEIKASFLAKYHQSHTASDEAIDIFIKNNVVFNVWPFWREHAFRMSTEANIPKPIIPLYKPNHK